MSRQKRKTILIIEDINYLQDHFKNAFEKEGFLVETASDGEEGLNKLLTKYYDAVYLDLTLPKIDGLKILEELKKKEIKQGEIIMVSNVDIESVDKAYSLGVSGYLQMEKMAPDQIIGQFQKILGVKSVSEKSKEVDKKIESESKILRKELTKDHLFMFFIIMAFALLFFLIFTSLAKTYSENYNLSKIVISFSSGVICILMLILTFPDKLVLLYTPIVKIAANFKKRVGLLGRTVLFLCLLVVAVYSLTKGVNLVREQFRTKTWTLFLYKSPLYTTHPYAKLEGYQEKSSCLEKGLQLKETLDEVDHFECGYDCQKNGGLERQFCTTLCNPSGCSE